MLLTIPKVSIIALTLSGVQGVAEKGSKAFNCSTLAAIYSALSTTLPTISGLGITSPTIVGDTTSDTVVINEDVSGNVEDTGDRVSIELVEDTGDKVSIDVSLSGIV